MSAAGGFFQSKNGTQYAGAGAAAAGKGGPGYGVDQYGKPTTYWNHHTGQYEAWPGKGGPGANPNGLPVSGSYAA